MAPLAMWPAEESHLGARGANKSLADPLGRPTPKRGRQGSPLATGPSAPAPGRGKWLMGHFATGAREKGKGKALLQGEPVRKYTGSVHTKDGDVVCHNYVSVSATDGPSASQGLRGTRLPNGGGAKVLKKPLTARERGGVEESIDSTPARTIQRHLKPAPIRRPAGQYESSGEDTPPSRRKPVSISATIAHLRAENRRLGDALAEETLKRVKLAAKINTVHRGLDAKLNRLLRELGRDDLI